jgi:hypothetical protein
LSETSHEQTETLFELEQPPPIRKGSRDYLAHLAGLPYRDPLWFSEGWALWALAPVEKNWARNPVTLRTVEHVWLVHDRRLHQALVDVATGEILRRRVYIPETVHVDRKAT